MGKKVHDDVLDGALNILKNNATRLTITSAEPADFTEADSTLKLADVTIDSSDFTNSNGDTNGRKTRIAAQASIPIDASGNATHVCLLDVDDSKLLYVTTCTTQALTSGGTVNTPAWDIEIADPT